MLTWNDILDYLANGNPDPPKVVECSEEDWKKRLTPEQYHITRERGTEAPDSSPENCVNFTPGLYTCVCCGNLLFDTKNKYNSRSGWPSFTQPVVNNAVRYMEDKTHGMKRVEVECNVCGAHLGHVFPDGPEPSGLRYCMNSIALVWHESSKDILATAVFGGGCFWCTEAIFKTINGVVKIEPGYAGGNIHNPSYKDICTGQTGHAEVIKVTYEPQVIDFATLVRIHLTTHDPTTLNYQGNDKGTQYRSVIFYETDKEKMAALEAIDEIARIYDNPIVTEVKPLKEFYPAEDYHSNYYERHIDEPYCKFVVEPKVVKYKKELSSLQKNVHK